jgi:hypothetical protein
MRHLIAASALFGGLALSVPFAAAQVQQQIPGGTSPTARYCLKSTTGALSCTYVSMAQCTQDATAKGGECVPNPRATTGTGATGQQ